MSVELGSELNSHQRAQRKWVLNNKEKVSSIQKAYRQKTKAKKNEYHKSYYHQNKEKIALQSKERYQKKKLAKQQAKDVDVIA